MANPEDTTSTEPVHGSGNVPADQRRETLERTKDMVHMTWAVIALALVMLLALVTAFAAYYRIWHEWGVL
jgi:hypothetical protein